MLKTGLEFAPGTTDDCKRLVGRMFTPTDILGSYRQARAQFRHGDVVLVAAEWDGSGFQAMPRLEYVKQIRESLGANAAKMMPVLTIAHKSAHAVLMMPFETDAMWLVINRKGMVPVMAVLYATPYEVEVEGTATPEMSAN